MKGDMVRCRLGRKGKGMVGVGMSTLKSSAMCVVV